jgi:hypothetical protein
LAGDLTGGPLPRFGAGGAGRHDVRMLDAVEQLAPFAAPLLAFGVGGLLFLAMDVGEDTEGEGGEERRR